MLAQTESRVPLSANVDKNADGRIVVLLEIQDDETCGEASILVGGAYQSARIDKCLASLLWISARLLHGPLWTNQSIFYERSRHIDITDNSTIFVEETNQNSLTRQNAVP